MILPGGTDANGTDVCISSIYNGGNSSDQSTYILGDAFLKNVVSVFDVGAAEMRFAAREFYPINDPA
jgi:Eukaryotic aspartyl protease